MRGSDLSGAILDDRYQIVERVAEGAMGVVYRAIRLKLDRPVAIKLMHSSLPGAMEGRKRFEREAKLMARLDHPHCVSVIDYGLHADKPYVVMELVRGRSLHDVLVDQGRFETSRALDILGQVLSGLAHAHEQGIIHRDIKPANLMITPKAPLGVHARILDFGLARLLGTSGSLSNGVAVGTPSYMSPEQCRGDELDARVDIYACGVLLFEMLTGKKPFIAADPIAIVKKHLQEAPPRLADVTPGDYGALEAVVARALAKAPADRYPTAVAMAEALMAALTGRTAAETTAEFELVGSSALQPADGYASVDIPVGSTAILPADTGSASAAITSTMGAAPVASADAGARSEVASRSVAPSDRDLPESSVLRRSLPVSRARYVALAALLAIAGAIAGLVVLRKYVADRAAVVPADAIARDAMVAVPAIADAPSDLAAELAASAQALATAGKLDAAIDSLIKARRQYPDRAVLPLTAGKLYFAKLWWNDGIASLRDAIKLDPSLRDDPDLIKTAIRGFLTTPLYDGRLARFVTELGPSAVPWLDETVQTHPNPERRSRAAALLRKLRP